MAFQKVVDTAEIDVIYTLNGAIVQNVFYAKLVGGYGLADLQAVADIIDLRIAGNWLNDQPPEAIYVRTEVRGLAVENDLVAEQNLSAGPGIHTGAALPNQVTFSVKKTSGLTGRSARGRSYWIGIPTNETQASNENFLNSAYAALVVENIKAIREGIAVVTPWQPVLVSRFSGGVKRDEGETFPWVGETNVDLRVDTNRGRLPQA